MKADVNSLEMKELFFAVSLMTIILAAGSVNAINAQPFTNQTSNSETESEPRAFTDCYASFYSGMILLQVSEKREIDSESEMKQFFTDTCNFIHDETGKWLDLWNMNELKMLYDQVDMTKFNSKYYPQGIPGSVLDVFSGMGAMAGAVSNGTSINMDDDDFEDEEDNGDNGDNGNNSDDSDDSDNGNNEDNGNNDNNN
jgi:cobalamin biosynthesis protein CobT